MNLYSQTRGCILATGESDAMSRRRWMNDKEHLQSKSNEVLSVRSSREKDDSVHEDNERHDEPVLNGMTNQQVQEISRWYERRVGFKLRKLLERSARVSNSFAPHITLERRRRVAHLQSQ